METTSPKLPELTPEQIWLAADYVELVWQDQGSEQEPAALEKFHQDGEALATAANFTPDFWTSPVAWDVLVAEIKQFDRSVRKGVAAVGFEPSFIPEV